MKKTITIMLLVCVGSVFAGYTHEIGPGDSASFSLNGYESLLMTGGQLHNLDLWEWSSARIEDTAPLVDELNGGIWEIAQGGYSFLEILGGEIHELDIASSSRTVISGGSIDILISRQIVGITHIEIICRDWEHDLSTNILTGTWEDFSTFNIQLVDDASYDAAIDNIEFTIVPEPASLLLLGVGGLLLRKRKS